MDNKLCEEKHKTVNDRLEKLENITTVIYSLASDVKLMAQELTTVKQDLTCLKEDKETRDNKPSRFWDIIQQTIITVITTSIVVMIINKLTEGK